jgi:LPS-assembly lipoprotein
VIGFVARRSVLLGCLASLAGCGFHPLYAPGEAQDAALSSIFVDLIPDRSGQLLREALQARLDANDNAEAKAFVLRVVYRESISGIGIQNDNSSTRTRLVGNATWSLHPVGEDSKQITGGTVRSLDGYNIVNEQFFYSDLSQEAVNRRLAEALADQITQALSVYFRKHPLKA